METEGLDVNQSEGSASLESTPASGAAQPAASGNDAASPNQEVAEQSIPYSRFKEINDKYKSVNDQFTNYQQQMSKHLQEMQTHFERQLEERFKSYNKPADPERQLIEELKGIRPEFGQLMEKMYGQLNQLQNLPQRMESQAEERLRQEARNSLNSLMDQHNLSQTDRVRYERAIKGLIAERESSVDQFGRPVRLGLDDLPTIFNEIHNDFSGFRKDLERSVRESYVKDKEKDAAVPSTKPGASASPKSASSAQPISRQDMISQIAKRIREAKQAI